MSNHHMCNGWINQWINTQSYAVENCEFEGFRIYRGYVVLDRDGMGTDAFFLNPGTPLYTPCNYNILFCIFFYIKISLILSE